MGTTIRRQPISFPIPASPDYKFLNITDFGGLNISSNPFVVSSNTASDCLNVYVDEDNALSTRPRLQLKYDLMSLAGLDDSYELIDVYDLHNGYLLHVAKDGNGHMYRFEETTDGLKTPVTITGDKPVEKCKIFEQNGNVYVLTGNGYKNIIENEISNVVGYIPTITIGKHATKKTQNEDGSVSVEIDEIGESYESLNLFSDKYKESYFWDGNWDYAKNLKATDVVENKYLKTSQIKNVSGILVGGLTDLQTNHFWILNGHEFQAYNSYGEMIKTAYVDVLRDFPHTEDEINGIWQSSYDGTVVINWVYDRRDVRIYYRDSADSKIFHKGAINLPFDTGFHSFRGMSNDGSRIVFGHDGYGELCVLYKDSGVGDDIETWSWSPYLVEYSGSTTSFYDYTVYVHPTKPMAFCISRENDSRPNILNIDLTSPNFTGTDFRFVAHKVDISLTSKIAPDISHLNVGFSPFDNKMLMEIEMTSQDTNSEGSTVRVATTAVLYFPDCTSLTNYTTLITNSSERAADLDTLLQDIVWSRDGKHAYYNTGYFNFSQETPIHFNGIDFEWGTMGITGHYATDSEIYVTVNGGDFLKSYFDWDSAEPELFITKNIDSYTDLPDNYFELAELSKQFKLFARFDNNTWFSSKNHTFHTLYNDPTYIPLSSYNDLGEDFEEITGLSIVNDNVLAAYKRNRIYIITPVTVGNQETYSYTETKNVVGNDVPDAPILTILTEMPTIVSYDGIFALNQLENVQSSDRITTLISENINPRWLKESSEDIDNCKTLNRLYWTYYILPHRRIGDENKDYTKIYLLDNRTQQWYYWELPIYVVNAMVKDNKTHFVHENGTVFTLEITDLIHEYNLDVTEYYDKVNDEKLIIPWHWTSQILSLSTINYSKKLVDTTFILTDTDTQDEYGLDYSFKAWRKSVSETNATTISNNIHYVQSTTKRTMIPRFNFIQIKLSNTAEDLDNNKLRLVGLGLKYVLLEGLY